jgi:cytochrome c oxidase subunit 3
MYFAVKKAKKSDKKRTVYLLVLSLVFSLAFGFFQFKGWSKYYSQGNAIKSFITFVYGQYGQSYIVYNGEYPIEYDGENYIFKGEVMEGSSVDELKTFLRQICGYGTSFQGSNLQLSNYDNPYSIYNVKKNSKLVMSSSGLTITNSSLSEGQKDELFKFSFGVCNDQPFFMLKGKYGEDFSIALNGEDLIYNKKKLYFPAKELSVEERNVISQKVYQSSNEYTVKNGQVLLNDQVVSDFEGFFQLKPGINIHIKNNFWERTKEELNASQYAEFYQTSNVSSSFVWVLTFIHFLHLIMSISGIMVVSFRANKGYYNSENTSGLKAIEVFWHFVGLLWLYLYVFLEYIN